MTDTAGQRRYDHDTNTFVNQASKRDHWRQGPYRRGTHAMSHNVPEDVDPVASRYNADRDLVRHFSQAHPDPQTPPDAKQAQAPELDLLHQP